jgi:hypothetical protein
MNWCLIWIPWQRSDQARKVLPYGQDRPRLFSGRHVPATVPVRCVLGSRRRAISRSRSSCLIRASCSVKAGLPLPVNLGRPSVSCCFCCRIQRCNAPAPMPRFRAVSSMLPLLLASLMASSLNSVVNVYRLLVMVASFCFSRLNCTSILPGQFHDLL